MIKKKTVPRFLLIPVLLYVLFYFISSMWIKSTCQNQLTALKPTQYGKIGIFVCRSNRHLFLTDHTRYLVSFSNHQINDFVEIYPDTGGGGTLHYIIGNRLTYVIDMNGTSFEVTPLQIKLLGWRWMDPIPDGFIRQIDTYGTSRYVDKETTRPVDVNDVYIIKDPRD